MQATLQTSASSDELTRAYEAVFSTAYGAMVLRDLAQQCGFMASLPIGASVEMLRDHNTRRAVFGHLYEILSHSVAGRDAIQWAIKPQDEEGSDT